MAAATFGVFSGNGSSVSWMQFKKKENKVNKVNKARICCSFSSAMEPYMTLRIQPGASESDVRKAFRRLALKYHPDVCKGNDCGVQFHKINEAYDTVMANLREESNLTKTDEGGMNPDLDYWEEEWMGFDGAGIRDYSSHINPYI